MAAVAMAAVLTVALFHAIGPRRTRLVAQIVAAVIGGSFVIGVQIAAIISSGTLSRLGFLQSSAVVDHAPDPASALWWPARAANGDWLGLTIVILVGATLLGAAACFCAPRFGRLALAAAGVSNGSLRRGRRSSFIRVGSPAQALRHKEWLLLWRDPWLMSQTLMQILYLLPPVFLLWQNFFNNGHAPVLVVPVLIMAAGQLAGGLAWLAISGEDAPDLIASAPLPGSLVWRAKAEAVFGGVVLVFGPCVAALAIIAPVAGLVGLLGIAAAVGSAILIQFWYRGQVKRSLFRRRHVSSRIATFAEALSSTTWAGTGALAAFGLGLAVVPGIAALAIVTGAWAISPRRN
jgi:ABC-2 type transport system permease protein